MSESKKEFAFYRRCHVCNHVSGDDEPVLECQSCAIVMAPFFYFDVRKTRVRDEGSFDNPSQEEQYRPIEGLTAYW